MTKTLRPSCASCPLGATWSKRSTKTRPCCHLTKKRASRRRLNVPPGPRRRCQARAPDHRRSLRAWKVAYTGEAVADIVEAIAYLNEPACCGFRLPLRSRPLSGARVMSVDRSTPRQISPDRQGHVTVTSRSARRWRSTPSGVTPTGRTAHRHTDDAGCSRLASGVPLAKAARLPASSSFFSSSMPKSSISFATTPVHPVW